MKPREYCCCAIPVINAGVYFTIVTQFVVALVVGVLSVATPHIVGAATPSFAALILAIICFVVAGIQVLGFIGVAMEKPILFRRYTTLHAIGTLGAFAVAAAWEIISATRHSSAQSKCISDFFSGGDSTIASEGQILCNVFPWVDVGIMAGLWVVLALLHIYLYVVLSSYSTAQQEDHQRYDQLNNDLIPMNKPSDPWNSHPSAEITSPHGGPNYNHVRQESAASASDVFSQPPIQQKDGYYGQDATYPYPPRSQLTRDGTTRTAYVPAIGKRPYENDFNYHHNGASL